MSLKAFLAQNAVKDEPREVIVSKRFLEDGKYVPFIIKAISEADNSKIRTSCTKITKGNSTFDTSRYLSKLCALTVISPELDNAELQKSYEVVGSEELLIKMLLPGEFATLLEAVQKINGYESEDFKEKQEEAKNS